MDLDPGLQTRHDLLYHQRQLEQEVLVFPELIRLPVFAVSSGRGHAHR